MSETRVQPSKLPPLQLKASDQGAEQPIVLRESAKAGAVRTESGNGRLTYEYRTNDAGRPVMAITHTRVHEASQGKGIGEKLVLAAIAHAREKGVTVLPECDFAKRLMTQRRNGEFDDVLDPSLSFER